MEVNKRVVTAGILIAFDRFLRPVRLVDDRMATGRAFTARVVPHVLHVALPAKLLGFELIYDGGYARRIDAAHADRLTVLRRAGRGEIHEALAVGLGDRVGRLTAH